MMCMPPCCGCSLRNRPHEADGPTQWNLDRRLTDVHGHVIEERLLRNLLPISSGSQTLANANGVLATSPGLPLRLPWVGGTHEDQLHRSCGEKRLAANVPRCSPKRPLGFPPPTHPLIHSSTHPLIHSATHPLIHSSTHPLIHSSTHPLIHSSTSHPLIHSSTHPLIHSSSHHTHPLTRTHPLTPLTPRRSE